MIDLLNWFLTRTASVTKPLCDVALTTDCTYGICKGHFNRWLKHKEYAEKYAEGPDGGAIPTRDEEESFGLTPSDESLRFVDSLYSEL